MKKLESASPSRNLANPTRPAAKSGLHQLLGQAVAKARSSATEKPATDRPAGDRPRPAASTAPVAGPQLEARLSSQRALGTSSPAAPSRNSTWSFALANQPVQTQEQTEDEAARQPAQDSPKPEATPEYLKGEVPEDWKPAYGQDGVTVYQDGQGQTFSQKVTTEQGVKTVETTTPDGAVHTVSSQDGSLTHETRFPAKNGEEKVVTQLTRPDGSVQVTTTNTSQSQQDLEELADLPEGQGDAVKTQLPENDRGSSTVKQVEVVEYPANSQQGEVVGRTREVSQSSSDVQGDLGEGITANPSDNKMTVTVTEVEILNPETGKFESSTAASAQIQLSGKRQDGSSVSAVETNTWNSEAGLETTHELRGFTESELRNGSFQATLGGQSTDVRPDTISGKDPIGHLKDKGDVIALPFTERHGDADQFLGTSEDGDMPVDLRVTVGRGPDGSTSESIEIGNLDPTQDGKTVSRMQTPDGQVSWEYRNVTNGGKDTYSQAVMEGSDLSQYREYHDTGNGTFRSHEATYKGGQAIDSRDLSRTQVSAAEIEADPTLSPEEKERLKAEPGPHYRDQVHQNVKSLVDDDGQLVLDENGNAVRDGLDFHSTSYLANGYQVTQANLNQASVGASSIHQVSDPKSEQPLTVTSKGPDGASVDIQVSTSQQPPVLKIDDEVVGEFEGSWGDSQSQASVALALPGFLADLAQTTPGTTSTKVDLNGALPENLRGPDNRLTVTQEGPLAKVAKAGGVLGMAWGSYQLVEGLASGNTRQSLTGLSSMGTSSLAFGMALSGLSGSSGAVGRLGDAGQVLAGPLGKALGVAGGVLQFGLGVERFASQDGKGQAAGLLTAAAGGAAVATVFFPPAALAALTLTALSWGVDKSAESDTVPVDSRVWYGNSAGEPEADS